MSYRVKLSQLRAYQAIMLTGSVTAAAERLHATQPAISRQLAALEDSLGFRLFDRSSGGRMVPTMLGLRFFRQIEGTLSGIEDIPELARELVRSGSARLRLGATPPLINSGLVSSALKQFLQKLPDTRLTLESRSRHDIEEWVANGQIDIGIALLPADNPALKIIPLTNVTAVAVMHSSSPAAKRRVLDVDSLRSNRLILPSRQLLRALIDRTSSEAGQALVPDIEASSALNCCKLAADGIGIALCDPFSPTAFSHQSLCIRRWKPEIPLSYGILISERQQPSSAAQTLIECLRLQASKGARTLMPNR